MTAVKGKGQMARVLIVAMLLLSIVVGSIPVAQAASLTSMTLTLSTSEPDATGVTHTFDYTVGTAATIKGIKYEYCTSGSGSCTAPTGLNSASAAISAGGTDNEFDAWSVSATTDTISITDNTGDSSNSSPTIAFSGIVNPSGATPTAFYVRITTYDDTGLSSVVDGPSQVVSAVIPVITVSGTQDAILELTVSGVSASTTVGDASDSKSTTAASTATTLPFSTFSPLGASSPESKVVAHTINVVTNGSNGYSASVVGGSAAMTRTGGAETIGYVSANTGLPSGVRRECPRRGRRRQ